MIRSLNIPTSVFLVTFYHYNHVQGVPGIMGIIAGSCSITLSAVCVSKLNSGKLLFSAHLHTGITTVYNSGPPLAPRVPMPILLTGTCLVCSIYHATVHTVIHTVVHTKIPSVCTCYLVLLEVVHEWTCSGEISYLSRESSFEGLSRAPLSAP